LCLCVCVCVCVHFVGLVAWIEIHVID